MLENGLSECPCKKKKCERFGNCAACLAYHAENKRHVLPYCKRKDHRKADKANKEK